MHVLVVDDHPLIRAGLEGVLNASDDIRVVGTAADGVGAVELARWFLPDVVLMDVSMPGGDGITATRRMQELQRPPAVVVLTSSCTAALVEEVFAAGAVGYLLKDMPPGRLGPSLRGIYDGRPPIDPRAARILTRLRRRRNAVDGSTAEQRSAV